MKRTIKHLRRWNIWRKYNKNSKLHKFLVLIDFIKSPSMVHVLLPEEQREIEKAFARGLKRGVMNGIYDDNINNG